MMSLYDLFFGERGATSRIVQASRVLFKGTGQATTMQEEANQEPTPITTTLGFEPPPPPTIQTYRTMGKFPTLKVVRDKLISPMIINDWEWKLKEGAPQQWMDEVSAVFDSQRSNIVRNACYGIDYGRQPFEVVWNRVGKFLAPEEFVPLLVDNTTYVQDNGKIVGLENTGRDRVPRQISARNSWMFRRGAEANSLDGNSLFENARKVWSQQEQLCSKFACYLTVISRITPIVHYPSGTSKDASGAIRPNSWIAAQMLSEMAMGRGVAALNEYASMLQAGRAQNPAGLTPAVIEKALEAAGLSNWKFEFADTRAGDYCGGFVTAFEYWDYQICRALGIPEQAVLHTRFGTRGQSQQHDRTADVISEMLYREICESLQEKVDDFLEVNFGREARGGLQLIAPHLSDESSTSIQEFIKGISVNPDVSMALAKITAMPAILDGLDIDVEEDQRDNWEALLEASQKQLSPEPQ